MIHGDDFVSTASPGELQWFKKELEKRFKIKTQVIGPGASYAKEGRALNRILRYTASGWEYEPDQRHAELIVKELGLDTANGLSTPGDKLRDGEIDETELDPQKATRYRQIGARANYLALDRPDIMFAVKEVCRSMSKPTVSSWNKLKKLGRYLRGRPRIIYKYDWTEMNYELTAHTDSDYAGCVLSLILI